MKATIVRLILTAALVGLVYRETGIWTSLAVLLLGIGSEAGCLVHSWHAERLEALELQSGANLLTRRIATLTDRINAKEAH